MKRCLITYEPIDKSRSYSEKGLHRLSPHLKELHPLALTQKELLQEALQRQSKMSVQGVQTKLSACLKIKECRFEIVDIKGRYILKPPSEHYPELPANEALTMSLAALTGLNIPVHGLIYTQDKMLVYFIKRFDRIGHQQKIATEDFAQLSLSNRKNKYKSSMEQVAKIIKTYCSVPQVELVKLFKLTLFNYLTGNEDMHLKNFSLITQNNIISLSPSYDLLNTTITGFKREEIALPLNGRKNNLRKKDFFEYFAQGLNLNEKILLNITSTFEKAVPEWLALIKHSFLSEQMQTAYIDLLQERCDKLKLSSSP